MIKYKINFIFQKILIKLLDEHIIKAILDSGLTERK